MSYTKAVLLALSAGSVLIAGCLAPTQERAAADQAQDIGRNSSVYIPMSDGTRIAADIWLPNPSAQQYLPQDHYPTIIRFTCYWRAAERIDGITTPPAVVEYFNRRGFAFMLVDARGTGASFGSRDIVLSTEETRDLPQVINWAAAQPWSNGAVATMGISYPGNLAENAMFNAPEALKAVIPRFTDFDWFNSILFPGGLRNRIITSDWGRFVRALDTNDLSVLSDEQRGEILGVKPVDGARRLLPRAIAEHQHNILMEDVFGPVVFRDDIREAKSLRDSKDSLVAIYRFKEAAEQSGVPAMHWGSFSDAGTGSGLIARFMSHKTPARYLIGSWSHGARNDADPFNPRETAVMPSFEEQYAAIANFLEPLRNGGEIELKPQLYYQTMGSGQWHQTDTWPPAGITDRRFYLQSEGKLAQQVSGEDQGYDEYEVNFDAGSGNTTRWSTQWGDDNDVYYGDRTAADQLLLTYTSAPLDRAMEITGHPVLNLQMSSSETDGAVIAYLEQVAPDGKVTMITEGLLRLIHRRISKEQPPYPQFGPYHSYLRKDALPMVPGKAAEITFSLLPTSIVVPRGHSLRLAIAGHDKDTFLRVPETGTPRYQLFRGGESYIDIPMKRFDGEKTAVDPFAF